MSEQESFTAFMKIVDASGLSTQEFMQTMENIFQRLQDAEASVVDHETRLTAGGL